MEAYKICEPCIIAFRDFGIFEWFMVGIACLFTIISLVSKVNLFALLKGMGKLVDKSLKKDGGSHGSEKEKRNRSADSSNGDNPGKVG